MAKIVPPWTDSQVASLNAWQKNALVHPFTCGGDRTDDRHHRYQLENGGGFGQLIAKADGWHCPVCNYTQKWAHDFMASQ